MVELPVNQREFIDAEVVLLSSEEGGRATPLLPGAYQGRYRPHIVLQPRGAREPKVEIRAGSKHIVDEYLAVSFWAGPDPIPISQPMTLALLLTYAPDPMYDALVPDAEFTIREGLKIIGHGRVLRRRTEKWAEPSTSPNGSLGARPGTSAPGEGTPSVSC